MPGTGTVTIGERVWSAHFATTIPEITTGLKNDELPATACMFFDLGYTFDHITIDMVDVRQALDVVFVNTGFKVTHVERNLLPYVSRDIPNTGTARYFMEVNAGEAVNVDANDDVIVVGLPGNGSGINMSEMMSLMITMMIVTMMMKMMTGTMKGE